MCNTRVLNTGNAIACYQDLGDVDTNATGMQHRQQSEYEYTCTHTYVYHESSSYCTIAPQPQFQWSQSLSECLGNSPPMRRGSRVFADAINAMGKQTITAGARRCQASLTACAVIGASRSVGWRPASRTLAAWSQTCGSATRWECWGNMFASTPWPRQGS